MPESYGRCRFNDETATIEEKEEKKKFIQRVKRLDLTTKEEWDVYMDRLWFIKGVMEYDYYPKEFQTKHGWDCIISMNPDDFSEWPEKFQSEETWALVVGNLPICDYVSDCIGKWPEKFQTKEVWRGLFLAYGDEYYNVRGGCPKEFLTKKDWETVARKARYESKARLNTVAGDAAHAFGAWDEEFYMYLINKYYEEEDFIKAVSTETKKQDAPIGTQPGEEDEMKKGCIEFIKNYHLTTKEEWDVYMDYLEFRYRVIKCDYYPEEFQTKHGWERIISMDPNKFYKCPEEFKSKEVWDRFVKQCPNSSFLAKWPKEFQTKEVWVGLFLTDGHLDPYVRENCPREFLTKEMWEKVAGKAIGFDSFNHITDLYDTCFYRFIKSAYREYGEEFAKYLCKKYNKEYEIYYNKIKRQVAPIGTQPGEE